MFYHNSEYRVLLLIVEEYVKEAKMCRIEWFLVQLQPFMLGRRRCERSRGYISTEITEQNEIQAQGR